MGKCEYCNGKGRAECTLEYGEDRHPENCPACGGDNWVICPICEGSGQSEDD